MGASLLGERFMPRMGTKRRHLRARADVCIRSLCPEPQASASLRSGRVPVAVTSARIRTMSVSMARIRASIASRGRGVVSWWK